MGRFCRLVFSWFLIIVFLTGIFQVSSCASVEAGQDVMEVHFIDVGQGDSTLITCGGQSMLIDAGDDSKGTLIQSYLRKHNVDKLDYLVLTHPDSDHIGGAPVIITKFQIDKVFISDFEKDNRTYEKLIEALDNRYLRYSTPKVGEKYLLGTAEITVLAPNQKYDNPNDASIALLVRNGEDRFLFTGDAGEEAEGDILSNGIDISADVYKVAHHGSRYSTSGDFFDAVSPSYAVISCMAGNQYGHPHAETMDTLRGNGVDVYRTDEEGTIVAVSDGEAITFNVPPSDSWQAGEPLGSAAVDVSGDAVEPDQNWQEKASEAETIVQEPYGEKVKSGDESGITYVLNKNTKKFHRPNCDSVETIKDKNREDSGKSREEVISQGYEPCKRCNP